jgi:hypothetical protein
MRPRQTPEPKKIDDGHVECPVCSKTFSKYGYQSHFRYAHRGDKDCPAGWNKGLTKETSKGVAKNAAASSRTMTQWHASLSPEEKLNHGKSISEAQKLSGKVGGIRRGSGLGKKGWFKGYWCDSTWELAWLIYHLDQGLAPERNRQGFRYVFEGKDHKYYPDFILAGTYHEIKGFLRASDHAKLLSFAGELRLWGSKEMKIPLEYCYNKYGKDLSKLYETIGS